MDPRFQARGVGVKHKKKKSNTHLYSIKKFSIKTNTQKSLFLNILGYNHLTRKIRHKTLLFLNILSMKRKLDALL